MLKKVCTKCCLELPATKEYFQVNKMGKYGLQSQCKACRQKMAEKNHEIEAKRKRKWYEANAEKAKATAGRHYQMNKSRLRQLNETWKVNNAERYRTLKTLHYQNNAESYKSRNKARFEENKEEILLQMAQYRAENSLKIKIYFRAYRRNPDNKGKIKIWSSAAKSRRRDKEKNLTADLTPEQWNACLEHFDHKCAYCGQSSDCLNMEHFIPVSKGGGFTVSNIVPSCGICNSMKNASDFSIWYPKQQFYLPIRERKILEYIAISSI
ncbi:hypothetical protein BJP48_30840 [Paenibacillus odorifer]|nr:hypothetical protein BJP48_30840 [Paenibacillus odorifer]